MPQSEKENPKDVRSRKASAALVVAFPDWPGWENAAADEIWEGDPTNTNKLSKKSEMINLTNKQQLEAKAR